MTDVAGLKERARERIESARDQLIELSHKIHANPELAFQEEKAAGWLTEALAGAGFEVEKPACGLDTAFIARAGDGSGDALHIAICAEYDCLPGIGHACGHNIIAASAIGAAIGAREAAEDAGLKLSVMGTPAEEGGGGKIIMLDRGGFDGVHAALMIHPSPADVMDPPIIAVSHFDVRYKGKEAHASSYPQQGINAADALTVAQVAIGLLRQHIRDTDRIHGIVTKGGDAPNIVPADTSAKYYVRAKTLSQLDEVKEKVLKCFEAGAVATGATLEVEDVEPPYSEMRHDPDLAQSYRRNAEGLGRAFVDAGPEMQRFAGSTDMGNVSLAIPSIHPMIGIASWPASNHQPEFTEHCATEAADRAVIDGAIAMAWTAIDAATDEAVRRRLASRAFSVSAR